jgi:glutathione S-transferase
VTHRLSCLPGSPFARTARALVLEWDLPVVPVEMGFPGQDEMFEVSPHGQVPGLLIETGAAVLPTLILLARLWRMAGGCPRRGNVIDRTAPRPVGPNRIGVGRVRRTPERFGRTNGWRAAARLGERVTLPGVAAAGLVLRAGARGGGHGPLPDAVRTLVEALAGRPSLRQTMPQPRSPGV